MSVDELLPQAKELAAEKGTLPSKTALQKALGVSWRRAVDVFDALAAETARERAERAAKRAAVASRRRTGRASAPRRVRLLHAAAAKTPAVEPVPVGLGGKWATAGGQAPVSPGRRRVSSWPLVPLAAPAFVAIWSGWVDLGRLTGFGIVHPLPGIAEGVRLNTAITLPIGLETYAAYALYVWLAAAVTARARRFARASAIGSLALGAGGQVAYHLMVAAGVQHAPWWITTVVACLPVAVLGMGAALRHLISEEVTHG